MNQWLRTHVGAAWRRERQRPGLSVAQNALIGLGLGVAAPVALIIKNHRDDVEAGRSNHNIDLDDAGMAAFIAAMGVLCSQKGWRGMILSSIGTAVLWAPLGGREPGVYTGENWVDTAAFGAVAGPLVVWPMVRLFARIV